MWLNAVWATHGQTFEREPLGASDGNPGQTFSVRRAPVLTGESVEVQEWRGRGEYWRAFVQNVAESDLRFERDPVSGEATAVWVRWRAQPHLHDSSATDRHYLIERARGLVTFGDGSHGMIPPAGTRVSLSYRSGGGPSGNLPADAISQLQTAVPFIMGATNPVPARGGAAIESMASVRARGPQRLRHRDRAVTPQDFEWLAHEASPEIARARCLALNGPDGRAQRGWVTIVVVPHSDTSQPDPTPEVRRRVREFVARRVPASVARQVRVEGPRYVAVSVAAEIVPQPGQSAAALEARVRGRLDRFLHPLTGGVAQRGWDFGEPAHLSHVASIIEGTDGVAYAREIGFSVEGRIFTDSVAVEPDVLVAPGDHELKLVLEAD
jgi:predicted phage baseplate assembly protein